MKKSAKNLGGLLAVLAVAMTAFGCASTNEWAVEKVSDRVKTETVQIDETARLEAVKLPKEVALVEVGRAPDADPALSDEMLGKMKENIIEEFAKFIKAGWSINPESPLKLCVIMSMCNSNHIKGDALFKKEDKIIAVFALELIKEKRLVGSLHGNTAYLTSGQLRRLFAHGIIKAIDGLAKNVEQK
jgi:hypothetical protein